MEILFPEPQVLVPPSVGFRVAGAFGSDQWRATKDRIAALTVTEWSAPSWGAKVGCAGSAPAASIRSHCRFRRALLVEDYAVLPDQYRCRRT
ncbi:MAG: hypothetical protein ACI8QZ_000356 [Chlamydiales bacterium]|jgi:hypothetical protein